MNFFTKKTSQGSDGPQLVVILSLSLYLPAAAGRLLLVIGARAFACLQFFRLLARSVSEPGKLGLLMSPGSGFQGLGELFFVKYRNLVGARSNELIRDRIAECGAGTGCRTTWGYFSCGSPSDDHLLHLPWRRRALRS